MQELVSTKPVPLYNGWLPIRNDADNSKMSSFASWTGLSWYAKVFQKALDRNQWCNPVIYPSVHLSVHPIDYYSTVVPCCYMDSSWNTTITFQPSDTSEVVSLMGLDRGLIVMRKIASQPSCSATPLLCHGRDDSGLLDASCKIQAKLVRLWSSIMVI